MVKWPPLFKTRRMVRIVSAVARTLFRSGFDSKLLWFTSDPGCSFKDWFREVLLDLSVTPVCKCLKFRVKAIQWKFFLLSSKLSEHTLVPPWTKKVAALGEIGKVSRWYTICHQKLSLSTIAQVSKGGTPCSVRHSSIFGHSWANNTFTYSCCISSDNCCAKLSASLKATATESSLLLRSPSPNKVTLLFNSWILFLMLCRRLLSTSSEEIWPVCLSSFSNVLSCSLSRLVCIWWTLSPKVTHSAGPYGTDPFLHRRTILICCLNVFRLTCNEGTFRDAFAK